MATFTTTTKWALRWLTGSNAVSDIDAGFQALAEDIDPKLTPFDQGALASRPDSTPGSPGVAGRFYRATDTNQVFQDTGTDWNEFVTVLRATSGNVNPPSIANGAVWETTVTVAGASANDCALAQFAGAAAAGITILANVSAANTVTVTFWNHSGAAVDLAVAKPIHVTVFADA